ncbi:MAG: hypothetical protein M1831_005700 [Alyxoria varia]|nr:MAG: hypothetical protein M1831_005700 [Alyxoria varia]
MLLLNGVALLGALIILKPILAAPHGEAPAENIASSSSGPPKSYLDNSVSEISSHQNGLTQRSALTKRQASREPRRKTKPAADASPVPAIFRRQTGGRRPAPALEDSQPLPRRARLELHSLMPNPRLGPGYWIERTYETNGVRVEAPPPPVATRREMFETLTHFLRPDGAMAAEGFARFRNGMINVDEYTMVWQWETGEPTTLRARWPSQIPSPLKCRVGESWLGNGEGRAKLEDYIESRFVYPVLAGLDNGRPMCEMTLQYTGLPFVLWYAVIELGVRRFQNVAELVQHYPQLWGLRLSSAPALEEGISNAGDIDAGAGDEEEGGDEEDDGDEQEGSDAGGTDAEGREARARPLVLSMVQGPLPPQREPLPRENVPAELQELWNTLL